MEEIWIIGTGHFGLHALRKLSNNHEKRHFVLVDPLRENLHQGRGPVAPLNSRTGQPF